MEMVDDCESRPHHAVAVLAERQRGSRIARTKNAKKNVARIQRLRNARKKQG